LALVVMKTCFRKGGSTAPYTSSDRPSQVINRIIEMVDSQVIGTQCDGFGFRKGNQRKAPTGLADHREFFTCLPEHPSRNTSGLRLRRLNAISRGGEPCESSPYKCSAPHATSFGFRCFPDLSY